VLRLVLGYSLLLLVKENKGAAAKDCLNYWGFNRGGF
jgi:hypothetical protein